MFNIFRPLVTHSGLSYVGLVDIVTSTNEKRNGNGVPLRFGPTIEPSSSLSVCLSLRFRVCLR